MISLHALRQWLDAALQPYFPFDADLIWQGALGIAAVAIVFAVPAVLILWARDRMSVRPGGRQWAQVAVVLFMLFCCLKLTQTEYRLDFKGALARARVVGNEPCARPRRWYPAICLDYEYEALDVDGHPGHYAGRGQIALSELGRFPTGSFVNVAYSPLDPSISRWPCRTAVRFYQYVIIDFLIALFILRLVLKATSLANTGSN